MRIAYQKGDTLIEVIMAVAVFSMVAVGAIAMMNQGVTVAQRSLEVTQVRMQMDSQAEAIRYIHQNYVAGDASGEAVWNAVLNEQRLDASVYGVDAMTGQCPDVAAIEHAFVINPYSVDIPAEALSPVSSMDTANAPPYSQVIIDSVNEATGYGIWVEAVPGIVNDTEFVDFHIRACWNTVGQQMPITLGTIVRVHVPES